jgi:hypothetical protein
VKRRKEGGKEGRKEKRNREERGNREGREKEEGDGVHTKVSSLSSL